jgi:UTP:GlnB (protein PII) uridylyltransferase
MSVISGATAIRSGGRDSAGELDDAHAPQGLVDGHIASMPRKYRGIFDESAIRVHAAILGRRGMRAAHAEIWRAFPPGGVGICVVGDDVPGLLARIGAALVAHELDVVAAQVYARRPPDRVAEAVGFFWVRRVKGPIPVDADIAALAETLDRLVAGRAGLEWLRRIAPIPSGPRTQTRLRFESDAMDHTVVLTVQGADRPGLLFLISTALFSEGVRITHSDISTHNGRALDRFHLSEMDGSPLRQARLVGIQNATLRVIEQGDAR